VEPEISVLGIDRTFMPSTPLTDSPLPSAHEL
jgi:hypothetical protein